MIPLVEKLKRCYEHSLELERIVPMLLGQLVGGRLNPTQHLETQQALVKQLAEILEFVLKFDEYKVIVSHPSSMNGYSTISILFLDENPRHSERFQLLPADCQPAAVRPQQQPDRDHRTSESDVPVLRTCHPHAQGAQRSDVEIRAGQLRQRGQHDGNARHDGQGVPADAGEPVSKALEYPVGCKWVFQFRFWISFYFFLQNKKI